MVLCKYYRQGNCRHGQYCHYEHINNFGNNKTESYNVEDMVATVAARVIAAERGGHWMLSCFKPFFDRPCVPGMEDLSQEEVRWDMYQAQKNGTVEEAKLRYQQLCQNMKTKMDALKNPTHETVTMLKKLAGSVQKSGMNSSGNVVGKSSFSFTAPQLGSASTSASNIFGNKTFSPQNNVFGNSFNSTSSGSIFGRTNNTAPVFGGTATFNSGIGFGNAINTTVGFGNTTNSSIFSGAQNALTFSSMAPQNNSVFGGGTSQSMFGQPSSFGATNQVANVFARPQTSQSPSVFNSGTTSSSLFGSPIVSQAGTNMLFSGNNTSTASIFGGSPSQTNTNSVFDAATSSATPPNTSTSIFGQPKTTAAFGGAPIFGGVSNFSNTGSIFGGQPFGNPSMPTGSIFGGGSTTSPAFGSISQGSNNAFGGTTSTSSSGVFGSAQNTGPVISAPGTIPFNTATTTPFGMTTSQFESTNTTSTPFSRPSFGLPTSGTGSTFGTSISAPNAAFGATNAVTGFTGTSVPSSTFSTSTFSGSSASPFASTSTTITTTTTNPFAPRTQNTSNSPFVNVIQSQTSSPFGKSSFGKACSSIVDDSIYTVEGQLTDDEKSMYIAQKFVLGKIPLKPPTKDIR